MHVLRPDLLQLPSHEANKARSDPPLAFVALHPRDGVALAANSGLQKLRAECASQASGVPGRGLEWLFAARPPALARRSSPWRLHSRR
jgi:hypothetical protein